MKLVCLILAHYGQQVVAAWFNDGCCFFNDGESHGYLNTIHQTGDFSGPSNGQLGLIRWSRMVNQMVHCGSSDGSLAHSHDKPMGHYGY